VRAKDDASGFGEATTVSRGKSEGLEPAGFAAVMRADISKLPVYTGAELPGQGYAVYRIAEVGMAKPDAARRQADQKQVAEVLAQQETFAYLEALKQKAKAKVLKPVGSLAAEQDGAQQ
jgi:peptidyl-prolyl cis-trans isomerase D